MCYLMQCITEVNWTAANRMKASLLADLYNFSNVGTIKLIYVQLELNTVYLVC